MNFATIDSRIVPKWDGRKREKEKDIFVYFIYAFFNVLY